MAAGKLKILQLINVRWYNACSHFAVTQARALANRGHDVIVMADPESPPAREGGRLGLPVDCSINFSSISGTFLNFFRFAGYIKKAKPDAIIAHRGESHLVAAVGARLSGLPVPVIRYRGDVRPPRVSPFSKWLNNKMTAGVWVSTKKHRVFYENRIFGSDFKKATNESIRRHPVRVIYPGIDIDYYQPRPRDRALAKKAGISKTDTIIGIVGRLSPVKGHDTFIEAAKIASLADSGLKFIIAGEDEKGRARHLQLAAELLGIKNKVIFYDRVDDIRPVMSLFDMGIVASTGSEAISRVLLEYMAMGIPVVATDVNQLPEVLGDCGLLVPPGQSGAMAESIIRLSSDKNMREDLARRALDKVKRCFTTEALGERSEALLMEIIDGENQSISE